MELPRLGRIAGVLFIACSIATIPSALLIEPPPPLSSHLVAVCGIALGIACLLAPWSRLSPATLHIPIIAGTVMVLIGIEVLNTSDYAFYYVIIGIYSAYVVPDRRSLALDLALITAALFAPLLLDPTDTRFEARHALVTLPVLLISSTAVFWQRIRLEERERSQRAFAAEAIELALRIRRGVTGQRPVGGPPPEEARLAELARQAEKAEATAAEQRTRTKS